MLDIDPRNDKNLWNLLNEEKLLKESQINQ